MKNFTQAGSNLTIPAPADVSSGYPVFAGEIRGIAAGSAATGDQVDVVTTGVFTLPKVAANNFALGAIVYWNSSNDLATTTASGNTRLGVAVAAAPADSAEVPVRLSAF